MPVADFPGRFGWGYDGVLPFAPHAAYGTPDELKAFIDSRRTAGADGVPRRGLQPLRPGRQLPARGTRPAFFSRRAPAPGARPSTSTARQPLVREFFIQNALYWTRSTASTACAWMPCTRSRRQPPARAGELSPRVRDGDAGRHVHLVLENENNGYHERLARHADRRPLRRAVERRLPPRAARGADRRDAAATTHDYGTHRTSRRWTCWRAASRTACCSRVPAQAGRRPRGEPTPPSAARALVNFAHNHDQVGNRAFGERLAVLAGPDAAPLPRCWRC
jgi:maltooligosyltrehalose trehalohydrolase